MESITTAVIAKVIMLCMIVIAPAYILTGSLLTKKSEPVPQEPVQVAKKVDEKQLKCLADNIYHEAGSESIHGQAAVARVVLNRIRYGFASTPCQVVYQANVITRIDEATQHMVKVKLCQFSWVCEKNVNKINPARYRTAKQIAYDVLAFDAYKDVVPRTTLFFHNLSIQPNWPHHKVKQIGNHIFYTKAKYVEKKPRHTKEQTVAVAD
jgi:spore germination cell wall hydrolase CwlJ-like protein